MPHYICAELEKREEERKEKWVVNLQPANAYYAPRNLVREEAGQALMVQHVSIAKLLLCRLFVGSK